MIKHKLLFILVCVYVFCNFMITDTEIYAFDGDKLIQTYDNVIKIDINAEGPLYSDHQKYNYSTSIKKEIVYILKYIDSFDLVDDGKVVNANDVSSYSFDIYMTDGSVKKYGFYSGRFYDNNNKQYAIDKLEYNRFLEFIYALNRQKLILPDNISLKPSQWAETEIETAIECGLVPEWNQIGYTNNITRLEVCQLVDNFLMIHGMKTDSSDISPFEDTSDPAVESLYSIGIINGKSESEFYPYDNVTREETAKILSGLCDVVGITSTEPGIKYVDTSEISDWAVNYVEHMSALGLFVGDDKNKFNPQSNLTKEELIITLLRLNEKIG